MGCLSYLSHVLFPRSLGIVHSNVCGDMAQHCLSQGHMAGMPGRHDERYSAGMPEQQLQSLHEHLGHHQVSSPQLLTTLRATLEQL